MTIFFAHAYFNSKKMIQLSLVTFDNDVIVMVLL